MKPILSYTKCTVCLPTTSHTNVYENKYHQQKTDGTSHANDCNILYLFPTCCYQKEGPTTQEKQKELPESLLVYMRRYLIAYVESENA